MSKAMSGAFVNEFQKWLENNPDAKNTYETEEEYSNDGSGNDSKCAMNMIHSDESEPESERLLKQLSSGSGDELMSGSLNDQAPILVDDDDDVFLGKKQEFEDEPPVLEPVPRQLQSFKISAERSPQLFHQSCMRNYSRNNQIHSKKSSLKDQKRCMKTSSNTGKMNHISPDTRDKSSQLKSKDNKSSNIFDKFSSKNYDFPPPLILSPEALQTDSEAPNSMAKHPSPDFCAMEADSTSEIDGDKVGYAFRSQRLSKNSVHGEVSIECDSTCMLAASPIIVSPSSLSNSEIEETRDSVEGGNKDSELQNNEYRSKKCDNAHEDKTESEEQSTLMQNAVQKIIIDKIACKEVSKANYFIDDSVSLKAEGLACHPGPQVPGICSLQSNDCKSLSATVKTDAVSYVSDLPVAHPVLSAVTASFRSPYMFRNKRHTIDSPETFSRLRKRPYMTPSTQTNTDSDVLGNSTPPTLTRVSETVITPSSRDKSSNVVSKRSKNECLSCHQGKNQNLRRRRQKRCNTFPVGELTEYDAYASEDLHKFVVATSQLSDLQAHMHRLFYQLFPQLKTKLDAMSPESFQFEHLLSDLVIVLEQTEEHGNSTPPPLLLCKDIKPTCIYEYPRPVKLNAKLDCTSSTIIEEPFSSSSDYQAATDSTEHILMSDGISCTSLSALSNSNTSDYHQTQHSRLKTHQNTSQDNDNDVLIPLSQLTLKDAQEILTPSKVLLCRDPEVSLERFIHLSCRALQHLLPDLTVNLYSELGKSPRDLVVFIDNVILTNFRRRSKH